jgi:hypothetical protein
VSLTEKRLCVFCGQKPNAKTREHVVPYWLLEMTGDPTRVVTFGQNFADGKKPIRYSWSNFVAPACDKCNNRYAKLEARVKPSIEALQRRDALTASAYIHLLDWLDKIRIGIWLTRHMLEKHPVMITPNFHISSRVAEKDRMVAVYAFDGMNKGLNLFGSDSLVFNSMPSCFALRINDILLLNISSDFFCSKGCGFPHPNSITVLMGGDNEGKIRLDGFSYSENVRRRITGLKLYKPVVWLYQPIKMPSSNPIFKGGYYGHTNPFDSRLSARSLQENGRQGALFRQYADDVHIVRESSDLIGFDQVIGKDCATLGDIVASAYDAQADLFNAFQYEWAGPTKHRDFDMAYRKLELDNLAELAEMYRGMGA